MSIFNDSPKIAEFPSVSSAQRFSRNNPCPVCNGFDAMPRGEGVRCYGFIATDSQYVFCTNENFAGNLTATEFQDRQVAFKHYLNGMCRCGNVHRPANGSSEPDAIYQYRLPNTHVVYEVLRYGKGKHKRFAVHRQIDGDPPRWEWNLNGTKKILYRLPELTSSIDTIYIVEGEKDADNLAAQGLTTTTAPFGAKAEWLPEYNQYFAGRDIVILPDNDDDGREHAARVAHSLRLFAKSLKVVLLPDLPHGGDVSDYLQSHNLTNLLQFVAAAGEYQELATMGGWDPVPISEVIKRPDIEIDWIWKGYIARKQITSFAAEYKSGKTTLLSLLFKALETGQDFCGLATRKSRVLVISEEADVLWKLRAKQFDLSDLSTILRPNDVSASFTMWEKFIVHITGHVNRRRYDLVVFDTLDNLWPVTNENDNAQIAQVLRPFHGIANTGAAVLYTRHPSKYAAVAGKKARGGSFGGGFDDYILEMDYANREQRSDTRRVLKAWGRWQADTQTELLLRLDGHKYIAENTVLFTANSLETSILDILTEYPNSTKDGILTNWNNIINLIAKPSEPTLRRALNKLSESDRIIPNGKGTKDNPHTYSLPK